MSNFIWAVAYFIIPIVPIMGVWFMICYHRVARQRAARSKWIIMINYSKMKAGDTDLIPYEYTETELEKRVWRMFTFRRAI